MDKENIFQLLHAVLITASPEQKAQQTIRAYDLCQSDKAWFDSSQELPQAPDMPARPEKPELLPPNKMPKRSKGYKNKIVLMHALAHIELNAIDLACDMVIRFANDNLPQEFYHDWLKVAYDEARHFIMLNDYLIENNSFYGEYPAHNSLWESAYQTRHHLAARLAVVPMVLEARGLDITPRMIQEFKTINETHVSDILTHIYHDEIHHVAIGVKWFEWVTKRPIQEATTLFHELLNQYFKGKLVPPFNIDARDTTLMPRDFYENYHNAKY